MTDKDNYFLTSTELRILTNGCKYISLNGVDVALTREQNIFIKLMPRKYENETTEDETTEDESAVSEYIKNRIDGAIKYVVEEGYITKSKKNKKVHVWVYV